ncbi:CinA family protein [Corynebacterium sp. H130]|uniref:CinA family protein n=1 Tax=Corynebacterium sp. H130 TaxID=3133444 RepID=UPI0030A2DEEC
MPNVIELLNGRSLATCESLTSGLLASLIASHPGASEVFVGGLVTYSASLKTKLAGVPAELIDAHGTISAECAAAMAQGTKERLNVDYALALTGVAGPTIQEGQPVGVVWLALAGPNRVKTVRVLPEGQTRWALRDGAAEPEEVLDGDRNTIRQRAAEFALHFLENELMGN